MELVPLLVHTAQQGLTVAAASRSDISSPGAIDGVFGSTTQSSLAAFASAANMFAPPLTQLELTSFLSTLRRVPDGATFVPVPLQIFSRLSELAARAPRPSTPREPVASAGTPAVFQPTAIIVPQTFPSWVLPAVIGVGVAALVVGGGYWLMKRSRRRR